MEVAPTDPPGAPRDSIFVQRVLRPTTLQVVPQPTSRADFLVGRDISVDARLPEGVRFVDGRLHYREGGARDSTTVPFEPYSVDFVPRAVIPAAAVGPRGLEFWAEVHSLTAELRYPRGRAPDSIRTLVPSLIEAGSHPGARYRMLSVPLDFSGGTARTLDALLSDQPEFGPYDPLRWRAFRFLGDAGNVEHRPDDARFDVVPGRAFWLVTRADHRVDTAPAEGLSVPTGTAFVLRLEPGWNQVGDPFAFPVAWESVRRPPAVEPPVAFDARLGVAGDYAPDPVAVLEPFAGYFVWNDGDSTATLLVPPIAAVPGAGANVAAGDGPTWSIEIAARAGTAADTGNRAGVHPRARDGLDPFDLHEPPQPPGDWVRAAFVAPESQAGRAGTATAPDLLRRDLRAPHTDGHSWLVELRSSATTVEIGVDLRLAGSVPSEFAIALVDLSQGSIVPLDAVAAARGFVAALHVLSHGPDHAYPLRLVAGTPAWVANESRQLVQPPARVALEPNAPNPFNAATRLRFGLPGQARVRLEIFDVRGRRVASLLDEERAAGWHSVIWNGHDAGGHGVASGVYICRLRTPQVTLTRRLTLIE